MKMIKFIAVFLFAFVVGCSKPSSEGATDSTAVEQVPAVDSVGVVQVDSIK